MENTVLDVCRPCKLRCKIHILWKASRRERWFWKSVQTRVVFSNLIFVFCNIKISFFQNSRDGTIIFRQVVNIVYFLFDMIIIIRSFICYLYLLWIKLWIYIWGGSSREEGRGGGLGFPTFDRFCWGAVKKIRLSICILQYSSFAADPVNYNIKSRFCEKRQNESVGFRKACKWEWCFPT